MQFYSKKTLESTLISLGAAKTGNKDQLIARLKSIVCDEKVPLTKPAKPVVRAQKKTSHFTLNKKPFDITKIRIKEGNMIATMGESKDSAVVRDLQYGRAQIYKIMDDDTEITRSPLVFSNLPDLYHTALVYFGYWPVKDVFVNGYQNEIDDGSDDGTDDRLFVIVYKVSKATKEPVTTVKEAIIFPDVNSLKHAMPGIVDIMRDN